MKFKLVTLASSTPGSVVPLAMFIPLLGLCPCLSQCNAWNIAKGTTDPRVEFISQVQTQILIKFHLQNLDQASTSNLNQTSVFRLNLNLKSWPNLASESWPRFNFITSTKHQRQNAEQTPASKSCLNFNFKILTNPCAQSLNKSLALGPNVSSQICNKLLPTQSSSSTSATVTTSTSFESAS